jgi:hypothetical protein
MRTDAAVNKLLSTEQMCPPTAWRALVRVTRGAQGDHASSGLKADVNGTKLFGCGLQDRQPRVGHGQERTAAQAGERAQPGVGQDGFYCGAVASADDRVELGGTGSKIRAAVSAASANAAMAWLARRRA